MYRRGSFTMDKQDAILAKSEEQSSFSKLLAKLEQASSIGLIILEQLIACITYFLPESMILMFTNIVRFFFYFYKSNDSLYNKYLSADTLKDDQLLLKIETLRLAENFKEIASINGFHIENHLVQTEDDYLLTVHRLNPEHNGFKPNGEVVFFQHGLLMNSEIWVLMCEKDHNLPFRLCELGYDVYLGNNRGNKYSNKHVSLSSKERKFWNFSIDEFGLFDIPGSIDYILNLTKKESLTYIGFSQGCSQVLSSISVHHSLNSKIQKLILISPATTPKRLSNWLIDSIVHFKPGLMYLLFGQKILLKSTLFWQRITYPPFFIKMIDLPNKILFDWNSYNINNIQKFICYFHLYSTTSVKSVVHWFQIIKAKKFQMYQDSELFDTFEYPIHSSIKIPRILLIYGMSDSLVDINLMLEQLPKFKHTNIISLTESDIGKPSITPCSSSSDMLDNVKVDERTPVTGTELSVIGVENYEHLDLIWGKNIDFYVIRNVLEFLKIQQ